MFSFLMAKLKNYLLERLAYNCPFNSLRVKFHKLRGVKIGKNVMIGLQVTLDHSYPEMITIEDDVSLAGNNYILTHSNPYPHFSNVFESFVAPVHIKKRAWLGIGAIVLPEVIIGEYSVIAAGSVVTKSIPPKVIAGGIPAKVLKDISKLLD
ncbi:acyltransferase [Flavobacteriaceae bacterium PRS1]|nr:acyltransferase [Flavobacteriaceae bacterium PRS1]